jgi:predicted amidohydrolase/dienelactone hydrolase
MSYLMIEMLFSVVMGWQSASAQPKAQVVTPPARVTGAVVNPVQFLHVASVQMRSSRSLAVNLARVKKYLQQCAAAGVQVAVFPECSLTGYFEDEFMRRITTEQIADALRQIGDACQKNGIYAVIGTPYWEGDKLYNSAVVLSPAGQVLERYHKIQLAERWPTGGDHLSVFKVDGVACSIMICHDERYPELVRLPVLAGARVIFYLSHESGLRAENKISPYRAQIQARAVENTVYVVHANAPANPDASGSHGQSRIIAPDGNLIREGSTFGEEVLTARLDLTKATAENAKGSIERGLFRDLYSDGVKQVRMLETSAPHTAEPGLAALLGRRIISPQLTQMELRNFAEARTPRVPQVRNKADWDKHAQHLRDALLDQVVFRGQAKAWRDAALKVEWLETIPGGPGYRIKKLRYEALPGVWIPALLYEPDKLDGKLPVVLNVNGHDPKGKAADYKQLRCINLAKRGMLALNLEWLGMGQLRTGNWEHYRMNQIDLCGSSGLAAFYLGMKRGLDVLLALGHADPERVAVTGLSGGGWQTIWLSALDTRVKLANPVAGFASFRTEAWAMNLGDSEQSPCDLATLADYTHLTALLAPRPTLLTYNARDDCCFVAAHALPPLLDAAAPFFRLYGKEAFLRTHVNHDPGTHNYERENREAFYRMVGDHFYAGAREFIAKEIPSSGEVKNPEELFVKLPADNDDFHTLAVALSRHLPRQPALPGAMAEARQWQQTQRSRLREIVRAKSYQVSALKAGSEVTGEVRATYWWLRMENAWTVPAVELVRGGRATAAKGTTILVADEGRRAATAAAERLLAAGQRVLAIDPYHFGESKLEAQAAPFALLVAAVGDRPLGIQASQVVACARRSLAEHPGNPPSIVALGPRASTVALVAAALEDKAISQLELHDCLGSLKEVIEQNRGADEMPEMFCFGLLEAFDIKHLAALAAPRPVVFMNASSRVQAEMKGLNAWYAALGRTFEPVRN